MVVSRWGMSTMEFNFSIGLHAPPWLILALVVSLASTARAMVRDRRTFWKSHLGMPGTKRALDDEGRRAEQLTKQIHAPKKAQ
jgi:hypothetical protein